MAILISCAQMSIELSPLKRHGAKKYKNAIIHET